MLGILCFFKNGFFIFPLEFCIPMEYNEKNEHKEAVPC